MRSSEVVKKMVAYFEGKPHDVQHFIKVYAYAKTIGELEGLDERTQSILEVAAILHDIACPLCVQKYGHAQGPYQEREGAILAAEFLRDCGFSAEFAGRVVYLVGHHHTLENIEGPDYQILIEADYLVNAHEGKLSREHIQNTLEKVFKTATGSFLLKSIYGL